MEVDPWKGPDAGASGANTPLFNGDGQPSTYQLHPRVAAVINRGTEEHNTPTATGEGASRDAAHGIRVEVSAGPLHAFSSGAGAAFASEDERQRRSLNPVTAATLVGKCACLLPPDLVRDRTVLDLGACLGAMCHWALMCGARKAEILKSPYI